MQSRVIVPNLPMRYDKQKSRDIASIDLAPALFYGSLVVCTKGRIHDYTAAQSAIVDAAKTSAPDDYVLCAGDVVSILMLMNKMQTVHGRIQLLRWDRRKNGYELTRDLVLR